MNSYGNKKIKIPGILIVFVLVVAGGFSVLAYALTDKIGGTDLSFARTGLSNITSYLGNEIEINKDEPITVEDVMTPIPTPQESLSLSPTATPQKTPTPSSMPTSIPKLNICSLALNYRIGNIHEQFTQNKFDRERLKKITIYAENQWESALGVNLFRYDNTGNSANVINFTQDVPTTIHDYYNGQFGQTRKSAFDENGIITEFEISIFSGIFSYIEQGPIYSGQLNTDYGLTESVITRSIMHHMGHILGLDYLPDGQAGIMAKTWIPTAFKPTMSQDDINYAKTLCK